MASIYLWGEGGIIRGAQLFQILFAGSRALIQRLSEREPFTLVVPAVYTLSTKNDNVSDVLIRELQGIKERGNYTYHYRNNCNETCGFVTFLL